MWLVGSYHNFSPIATSKITSNSLLTATHMPIYATPNPNNFSPIRKILWLTINVCRLYLESPVIQSHAQFYFSQQSQIINPLFPEKWLKLGIHYKFLKTICYNKNIICNPHKWNNISTDLFLAKVAKNNLKLPKYG